MIQQINLLLAQLRHFTPIFVRNGEPFAIARTNVDIDRRKIVVFLMARRSTSGNFQVQLQRIHAEHRTIQMRQHVRRRRQTTKCGQFSKFFQLFRPFSFIRQINVRAESNLSKLPIRLAISMEWLKLQAHRMIRSRFQPHPFLFFLKALKVNFPHFAPRFIELIVLYPY